MAWKEMTFYSHGRTSLDLVNTSCALAIASQAMVTGLLYDSQQLLVL